jgi:hypothetical protein
MRSHNVRTASFAIALAMSAAAPAGAQILETPVPFDSTGKVPTVTPGLAQRLGLGAPGWPVTGEFERVRLYRSSTGEYVLVAERRDGALERWPMVQAEGDALRSRVASSLRESTRGIGTQTTVASEPAGNSFVRRQASLGTLLYGPAAMFMMADENGGDGSAAGAAYFFVAGGTFFAAMARRQASPPVTTAQNNLSTWGAIHGAALGGAAAYMMDTESGQGAAGMIFAGSVGGTVLGLAAAKDMTDAESAASSFAATSAALTTLGVAGAIDMYEDEGSSRGAIGLASGALIAGHLMGPRYPRRADYVVTAGDVRSLWVPGVIGASAALVPFVDSDDDNGNAAAAAVTAGFVGGVLLGDRLLVKPYDHSTSDAVLLWTGATAGALVGGGLSVLADADGKLAQAAGVTGATLGALFTESLIRKSPQGREVDALIRPRKESRVGVTVDPAGLIFAAARAPGRFSLVRMTF